MKTNRRKVGAGGTAVVALFLALAAPGAISGERCALDHCHDGDTCTLICAGERVKVRLHCIDAPEMKQAPWGKLSRDYLKQRAPAGSVVDLVSMTRDKYGRTVGVVLLDGVNLRSQPGSGRMGGGLSEVLRRSGFLPGAGERPGP